jgi:Leucine-rich repeat (LRR) protein
MFILDLSFNNITRLEGLDSLTELTDLSLYNNRITVIENMDSLKKLNVFSIGNNQVDDENSVSKKIFLI